MRQNGTSHARTRARKKPNKARTDPREVEALLGAGEGAERDKERPAREQALPPRPEHARPREPVNPRVGVDREVGGNQHCMHACAEI